MAKPLTFAGALLFTSALTTPAAMAQAPAAEPAQPAPAAEAAPASGDVKSNDVSVPGGDIVVTGRRNQNIAQQAPAVVSVLSAADIARTGEGNIAGSLGRITGLSVVGNGFVYVRGLGDRYSLALLNGSPLPSPEPLRRVVPLDIFPTNIIASSLVQKSFSANFPGEFGGGVINLTTKAVPTESFLTIGGSIGGDSETTAQLGYTYYGSGTDWSGFDNGSRDVPPALAAFFASGEKLPDLPLAGRQAIAAQLVNGKNALLQRNKDVPPNWGANITAGTSFDIGDSGKIGFIATAAITNKWRTRDTLQQAADTLDLSSKRFDFERVITEDRVVVNAMLATGLEFGRNTIRWTNLYIRDTLKQARLGNGIDFTSGSRHRIIQDTAWFERQLINSQFVGAFKFDNLSVDVRGSYANSQREAPAEISIGYVEFASGPYQGNFLNRLNAGLGTAEVSYSNLNENLWSGGLDLSYPASDTLSFTVGGALTDTRRTSSRREFIYRAPSTLPEGVSMMRPDNLLGGAVIQAFGIDLIESTESDPAFKASLTTKAGYAQLKWEASDTINLNLGLRYETANQKVAPLQLFNVPSNSGASNQLKNDYWLPGATLTWEVGDKMQVRVSASKTIARPQFRELLFQQYYDPESNRLFRGNPALQDTRIYNADARYEWYFARDQQVSVSAFYKKLKKPIEAYGAFIAEDPFTSFANAPDARLYGAEFEVKKYFGEWGSRRALAVANYTFSKSKVTVGPNDKTNIYTGSPGSTEQPASNFFLDGRPLTGQSNHLVNLEMGLEDRDHLSQQTFLLTYASKRLTSRGPGLLPDIYEYPGFKLDFVARQGIRLFGTDLEAKLEVRNITGTGYKEYQQSGANRIYYNKYKVGTSASFGVSATF